MTEILGWFSSAVLVLTIARQVYRQWRTGTSRGVSIWLFIGQATASAGFTVYSALLGNAVFAVTNAVCLAGALAGLVIVVRHRREERSTALTPSDAAPDRGRAPGARAHA